MLNWLKGYRTQLFGLMIAILGLLEQYAREVFPEEWQGFILLAVGIAIIILREITNTAPRRKE